MRVSLQRASLTGTPATLTVHATDTLEAAMTRRRWTGLAGLLFGLVMFIGVFVSGTTPDSDGGDVVKRYTEYWADQANQDDAALGAIVLTYACVLLALFAAGLRSLLSRLEQGALPFVVLGAGSAAAATLAAGAMMLNGPGIAAAESSAYTSTASDALLHEGLGYYVAATAMMLAAAMAVTFSIANRRARVVPQWTMILSALLGLVALGSIFAAWVAFMLLPVWAIVMGICLLTGRDDVEPVVVTTTTTQPLI